MDTDTKFRISKCLVEQAWAEARQSKVDVLDTQAFVDLVSFMRALPSSTMFDVSNDETLINVLAWIWDLDKEAH